MLHMINWEALRTRRTRYLVLDLVMLSLALLHLLLLVFDTTYFQMRPYYLHWFPERTAQYDLLKGISPHHDTQAYQSAARHFFNTCRDAQQVSALQLQSMLGLSDELIEEDPFARAGLSGQLEIIKAEMREFTGVQDSSKEAFNSFWQAGCKNWQQREAFFMREIEPRLALNYWRRIGTNGRYIDYFVYIDLSFILIFLIEFILSWRQAVRQLGPDQKILYPLTHWYDLVSCIPLQQLRILRLLRVLTIYYRLVSSQVILIHNSRIYQKVLKYQSIIMEEISDRVAVNILTNIQAKTRLGGSKELIKDTLEANRDEIRDVILANLQKIDLPTVQLRQQELVDILASMIMQSIRATDEYRSLTSLPLVRPLVESVLNQERMAHISEQAMDAFLEAWQQKLRSPEMQSILHDLIDDILDQVLSLALDNRIQLLLQDINLKILEELKEISTTSKIWKSQQDELLIERIQEIQQRPEV